MRAEIRLHFCSVPCCFRNLTKTAMWWHSVKFPVSYFMKFHSAICKLWHVSGGTRRYGKTNGNIFATCSYKRVKKIKLVQIRHMSIFVSHRSLMWLGAGRSGDRIPVGARFSAPVQPGPGIHRASCMCTISLSQG